MNKLNKRIMLQNFTLYFYTLKYLKWIQIQYQLWYILRKKWRKITKSKYIYKRKLPDFDPISMGPSIDNYCTYLGQNKFMFLNLKHNFDASINWDYTMHGKLWTYNLNYFEYLNQKNNIQFKSEYRQLISDFIKHLPLLNNANEPFPTSLRIINWIKYFVNNKISDHNWNTSLYCQSYILFNNIEYHLLGNHLLENGFALTISGLYFQDNKLYKKGKKILESELKEQILNDGAHFELSPMYHCLMLYRLLDTLNLLKSNECIVNILSSDSKDFISFLNSKLTIMCGWLKAMTFNDGSFPHFNDSTNGIAPTVEQLLSYAENLDIEMQNSKLENSGYRRLKNEYFDLFIKAGKIGADYIPGHGHADSLSIVCKIGDQNILVDTSISTYEKNKKRQEERSTEYHNTVNVNGKDSSQVWSGFRVGKRAFTTIKSESEEKIVAYHNAYDQSHSRSVMIASKSIVIEDNIDISNCTAHFHFHPDICLYHIKNSLILNDRTKMVFTNAQKIEVIQYSYCEGFNKTITALKVKVGFDNSLISKIIID